MNNTLENIIKEAYENTTSVQEVNDIYNMIKIINQKQMETAWINVIRMSA